MFTVEGKREREKKRKRKTSGGETSLMLVKRFDVQETRERKEKDNDQKVTGEKKGKRKGRERKRKGEKGIEA